MNLLSVSLENFLIISSAKIDLQNRGLVRIAGENSDDSTSISNGSGKSSLIEGVYWALFGDTLRNLKSSDNVVNRNVGKNCSVTLEFEEGSNRYRVERYRKHSKKKNNLYLYINDVDSRGKDNRETQEYIEDLIGMDKTSFSNAIVFGQGHSKNLKRFSEMTDSEKKATLEKVLSLEVFGEAHTKVKERLATLETDALLKKQSWESLKSRAQELSSRKSEVMGSRDTFESRRESRIAVVFGERDQLLLSIESLEQDLAIQEGNHTPVPELESTIQECNTLLEAEAAELESLKDKVSEEKTKITVTIRSILSDIERDQAKWNKLSDGSDAGEQCEYCASVISSATIANEKDGLEFEISDRKRTLDHLKEDIEKVSKEYDSAKLGIVENIDSIKEIIDSCRGRINESHSVQRKIDSILSEIKHSTDKITRLDKQQKEIELEENPWVDVLAGVDDDIEKLKVEKDELKDSFGDFEEKLAQLTFWRTAFSRQGIRSYLLDKIVPFLNERVAHYLNILTDGGITAKFSTVKQLASGEYRENFNLEVINRHASESYEGNSGGEKRRIDLAVALAFNDFLASRSGKRFNILLLDEVFEGIDAEGLYYVIKVLEDLARRKSSVFVITHRDELKSYFSDEILIRRESGLSLVV